MTNASAGGIIRPTLMIRRRTTDGFLLIRQSEPARLAGVLAALIGEGFASPSAPASLTTAASLHESGWEELDNRIAMSLSGQPISYAEQPLIPLLHAWRRSVDIAQAADAYAGLLLSIMALQRAAAVPRVVRTMREVFETNKHQHREIERQEQLRAELGLRNDIAMRYGLPEADVEVTGEEQAFIYDYRVLVLLSQIALELCAHTRPFGELAPCPTTPGASGITVRYRWIADGRLELTPWPFRKREIRLTIVGRILPARLYDHERELQQTLAAAAEVSQNVVLAPGKGF